MNSFLQQCEYLPTDDWLKLCIKVMQFENYAKVAVFANTHDHARILARRFNELLESIPDWYRFGLVRSIQTKFEFENGSTIQFMSNSLHSKGQSFTIVGIFDQRDWTEDDIMAIIPCVYHGSRIKRFS